MVPRCSATWRAEYKRVKPSNRGLANHVAVSPISHSNEFMAGFPAASESNDLMTGSCRSCTALLLAISIPRFCVTQVPPRPGSVPSDPAAGTPDRGEGPRTAPPPRPSRPSSRPRWVRPGTRLWPELHTARVAPPQLELELAAMQQR